MLHPSDLYISLNLRIKYTEKTVCGCIQMMIYGLVVEPKCYDQSKIIYKQTCPLDQSRNVTLCECNVHSNLSNSMLLEVFKHTRCPAD